MLRKTLQFFISKNICVQYFVEVISAKAEAGLSCTFVKYQLVPLGGVMSYLARQCIPTGGDSVSEIIQSVMRTTSFGDRVYCYILFFMT